MMKKQCNQISNGCLEKFQKISLLAVAIMFLFTFFNLILDAPRIYVLCGQYFVECENTWIWSGSGGSCSVGSRLAASSCKPIQLTQYHPTKYIFFDTYMSLQILPHLSSRYLIHQHHRVHILLYSVISTLSQSLLLSLTPSS
jgi:hypothetical protein